MVSSFKTSYRWLRERESPVGVKAKEWMCVFMCVCEEKEPRGQRREKQEKKKRRRRGGLGEAEGAVWNVNDEWGVGGHPSVCVCVSIHRGVVLGEALMEKPWDPPLTPTPPPLLPSPTSWSAHTHTHAKINLTSNNKNKHKNKDKNKHRTVC